MTLELIDELEWWLALAGAHTEAAMTADLQEVLAPGQTVLDAGCGTGALAPPSCAAS